MTGGGNMRTGTLVTLALWGAVGAGAAGLAGCDTTAAPFPGRADPVQPYPRVSVAGPLYELVAFTEPTVTAGAGSSPMRVSTPCRSTQDGITRVQYQYEWFDAEGRPLDASGWKYVVIPARSEVFMESNALSSRAADWRLTVRPAG
jgi:hypothetical protein